MALGCHFNLITSSGEKPSQRTKQLIKETISKKFHSELLHGIKTVASTGIHDLTDK